MSDYVLGHNDRERARLALQASFLKPFTESLLRRAGVTTGLRVLDLGCGMGDVALLAAELVGRHGSVTTVDIDAAALATARDRAAQQGFRNITFVHSSIDALPAGGAYDVVTGRLILIHSPDPLAALRKSWDCLREGGVAIFQEFESATRFPCYPPWPLRDQLLQFINDFLCRAAQGEIGRRLFHLFLEAGFTTPDCRVEIPVTAGPDALFFEWVVETVRSLFPGAQALGMTDGWAVDLDTVTERLMKEAAELNASFPGPLMASCFGRKPAAA